MEQLTLSKILLYQQSLIEKIAQGDSAADCLNAICQYIEILLGRNNVRSSIILFEEGRIKVAAGERMPNEFHEAVEGLKVSDVIAGFTCAEQTQESYISSNIKDDPKWHDCAELLVANDIHASWSIPIFSSAHAVMGTVTLYCSEYACPTDGQVNVIQHFSHLASVAIERCNMEKKNTLLANRLQRSRERLKAFSSVMPDLCIVLNEAGDYVDVYGDKNGLAVSSSIKLIGRNVRDVIEDPLLGQVLETIDAALKSKNVQTLEYGLNIPLGFRLFEGRVVRLDHYNIEQPEDRHVLWMARDITEKKQSEQKIERLAFYDSLTQLPNRRLLFNRLEQVITRVRRKQSVSALLFLDLDNFKRINDALGHEVGDQLLIEVAQRILPRLRKSDTFARLAGDEFCILLDTIDENRARIAEEAAYVATKVVEVMSAPVVLNDLNYHVKTSIGICLIEGPSVSADSVLKNADAAMYEAKRRGGSCFVYFDPKMQSKMSLRLRMEEELRDALAKNEIETHFQPQVNQKKQMISVEALVRWVHPIKGIIPPDQFIPVAENTGLIHEVQHIVLEDVCRLIQKLDRLNLMPPGFEVAINLSASQMQPNLEKKLLNTLSKFDVQPYLIKLELTETMLADTRYNVMELMWSLKQAGFKLSIDDFGTGYSSMDCLQKYPIDEIKIDKSFIDHCGDSGASVIDAIISMGDSFGFSVVAEGVETREQSSLLWDKHIDLMQGYYFSQAMSSFDFIAKLNCVVPLPVRH